MAVKINEKACKGRKPSYNKLTVRLNTLMLEFYQVLTKEQFNTLKSKAITGNLKTKYTPEIMRHSAIFWFRRNDLTEAGRLIQRAIEINSKVLNDASEHKHESYIKLFVWQALIATKSKNYAKSQELMTKAKQIAQSADNYGTALDNYFLMWEIENLSLMGSSKYDEILKLTKQYFKKHAELTSIGDEDTYLKYHALLKVAPEVITTFDVIDVNNEDVR